MKRGRILFVILSAVCFGMILTGFMPKEELPPTIGGILYKELNHDKLKMDLYYPEEESYGGYPVVLFVHGGERCFGSRQDLAQGELREVTEKFLSEGFVVAGIDYRTISLRSGFSSGVIDTKDAIRWLKSEAENYRLDSDNIGLWGVDRGAQISLLAAYTGERAYQGIKVLAPYSAGVKYILAYNATTDLVKRYQLDEIHDLDDATYQKRVKQIYTLMRLSIRSMNQRETAIQTAIFYSPLTYVAPDVPATYVICATGGDAAPDVQGKLLKEVFEDNGLALPMTVLETGTGDFQTLSADEQAFLVDISANYLKMGAFHSENYIHDLIIYPDPCRLERLDSEGENEQNMDEPQGVKTSAQGLWTQWVEGVQRWFQ